MKKLTLVFAVCVLSAGAMAQKTGTKKAPPPPPAPPVVKMAVVPPPPKAPEPPKAVTRFNYKKSKKSTAKFKHPVIVQEQQVQAQ